MVRALDALVELAARVPLLGLLIVTGLGLVADAAHACTRRGRRRESLDALL